MRDGAGCGINFSLFKALLLIKERDLMNSIDHPVAGRDLGEQFQVPAFAGMSETFKGEPQSIGTLMQQIDFFPVEPLPLSPIFCHKAALRLGRTKPSPAGRHPGLR